MLQTLRLHYIDSALEIINLTSTDLDVYSWRLSGEVDCAVHISIYTLELMQSGGKYNQVSCSIGIGSTGARCEASLNEAQTDVFGVSFSPKERPVE